MFYNTHSTYSKKQSIYGEVEHQYNVLKTKGESKIDVSLKLEITIIILVLT